VKWPTQVNLKPLNDTLGHVVGGLKLKEVARRLRQVVTRQSVTVSRLGGDEFVILLQRVNTKHDAEVIADKILCTLSKPFNINQLVLNIYPERAGRPLFGRSFRDGPAPGNRRSPVSACCSAR
jgi:GGDEF domain-containing protein